MKFLATLMACMMLAVCGYAGVKEDNIKTYNQVKTEVDQGAYYTLYVGVPKGKPETGTILAYMKSWEGVSTEEEDGVYRCYRDPETGKCKMARILKAYLPLNTACGCTDCPCRGCACAFAIYPKPTAVEKECKT